MKRFFFFRLMREGIKTYITGNFSGGLGSLEGNSIQPQIITRCPDLLPRCLVSFLQGETIKKWFEIFFPKI